MSILYEATNGWMGCSYVRCLIIAEDEEMARTVALSQFKAVNKKKSHWDTIELKILCSDTTKLWMGEVSDE